jgi:hypothetical protein
VLHDVNSTVYRLYSVRGFTPFPRDCIIDPQGIVRYLHSEYDPQAMLATIQEIQEDVLASSDKLKSIPRTYSLNIFPNPFNPQTTIRITLPQQEDVHLRVFNIRGQLITGSRLSSQGIDEGVLSIPLDMTNYPSGIYFVSVIVRNIHMSQKIVLLK